MSICTDDPKPSTREPIVYSAADTRLLLRPKEAAERLNIGKTQLFALLQRGELRSLLPFRPQKAAASLSSTSTEFIERKLAEAVPTVADTRLLLRAEEVVERLAGSSTRCPACAPTAKPRSRPNHNLWLIELGVELVGDIRPGTRRLHITGTPGNLVATEIRPEESPAAWSLN